MLCLGRKRGEQILIGSGPDAVRVTVIEIDRNRVKLGIDAPQEVRVDRSEVREAQDAERMNGEASRHA